jgi:predicted nucleic acid-binding Zn ribbon protein
MSPVGPDEPTRLRDALARVGADLGLPPAAALEALEARWPDIVGAEMAAHTRVAGVRDGTLTVVVTDTGRATRLRYGEDQLTRAAARVVGAGVVRRVRVRVEAAH